MKTRLRRKVDGSNETPLIRNVRGEGFVLSADSALAGFTRRDMASDRET